jgi:hypothetical protein
LPACSIGTDDGAETTLAPTATGVETTTTAPTTTAASAPLEGLGPFEVASTVVSHETTQEISVFAREAEGSWPVAYMFHCYDCDRQDSAEMGKQLASHGMVVFVPDYRSTDAPVTREQDLECAYRYARSIAPEYGGDLDSR